MLRNPFGNVNPSANYNEWPLSKFSFIVNIGGMGGNLEFETMDGLGATIDPVTLKKGVFQGQNDLYDWFSNVAAGSLFGDSRTVTIQLTELNSGFGGESAGHQVHFQWTLEKAYVTKFTPPSLDGGAESEVAVEEVELSYQTFSTNANPLAALLGNLF
jgi:phage tail-like protein